MTDNLADLIFTYLIHFCAPFKYWCYTCLLPIYASSILYEFWAFDLSSVAIMIAISLDLVLQGHSDKKEAGSICRWSFKLLLPLSVSWNTMRALKMLSWFIKMLLNFSFLYAYDLLHWIGSTMKNLKTLTAIKIPKNIGLYNLWK